MTPQERQLIDELFDRLSRLESAPRDPEAERAIAEGLQRSPHAVYALVQTALVQDEALRRADARIRELSGEDEQPRQPAGGSFLDTMRSALGGGRSGGSVPNVRQQQPQPGPDPRWNTGGAIPGAGAAPGYAPGAGYGAPPQASPFGAAPSAGGSFLGTAAASAVGAIGGAMLFNSIGSLFGRHEGGSAFGSQQAFTSPWDSSSGSDLSQQAGFNDINGVGGVNDPQAAGLFGNNDDVTEVDETDYVDNNDDFSNDDGGFGGGDGGTQDV
jgi:hypothetical protein